MSANASASRSFTLREATAADAGSIAALLEELGHPVPVEDVPRRLCGLHDEGGVVLLAFDAAGTPLGLVSFARHTVLHAPGPVGYITALVTTAASRRTGVGRAFVAAAKEWATRHGCARLIVTSAEHRAEAHAFYAACGMPYTGRRFAMSLPNSEEMV